MTKKPILIAVVVIIAALFGVDQWLRAKKKFIGGEVPDGVPGASQSITTGPKSGPAPVTPDSIEKELASTTDLGARAKLMIKLDDALISKAGGIAIAKKDTTLWPRRKKVLENLASEYRDFPESFEASQRMLYQALWDKEDAGIIAATDAALAIITRLGVHEAGVSTRQIDAMIQLIADNARPPEEPKLGMEDRRALLTGVRKEQARRLQEALDSPDRFGPENIREQARYRIGMRLETSVIKPGSSGAIDQSVEIVRRNDSGKAVSEEITWHVPGEGWKVEPMSAKVSLEPGSEKTLAFHVRFTGAVGQMPPFPWVDSVAKREADNPLEQSARLNVDTRNYYLTRLAHVARAAKAPELDGKLDDACWKACEPLSGFGEWSGRAPASPATVARMCYDDKGLYIAIQCDEPTPADVVGTQTQRDADVCLDDSVEFFLNPRPEQEDYFQVVVNARNVQYDGIGWDRSFNFKWTSAVAGNDAGWAVEIFLPWAEFGVEDVPKAGVTMLGNLVRNRPRTAARELQQWSPTYLRDNHRRGYLATLRFE